MNRLIRALGLCIVLAGCANGDDAIATGGSAVRHGAGPAAKCAFATARNANVRLLPPPRRSGRSAWSPTQMDDGIWVVNADGTDAHELLPNAPEIQYPLAWSGDGSRLLYGHGTKVTSR